jgi:tetratricopeptide (TPR) repeat protein
MCKHLFVLVLLFAPLSASAGNPSQHWLQVTSPHFIVITDSNEKQARHIAAQFEQMRSVFHTLIPNAASDTGAPITVLALKDRKGFQAVEPAAYLAKNQLDLAGLFMSAPDRNYILLRLDAQGEHPFDTVYHEYTHFIFRKDTWLPLWLNEGLAEFYQNTDIQEKDVLLGQPSADNIYYLRDNSLLPLTTLLKVDYSSPYYHDEQKGSVFYAESWALTHYIEITDAENNTNHLRDYAALLIQNQDPVTAAQQVFGDLKHLQNSLYYYIQQGSFKMFKMKSVVIVDPSLFQVAQISQPEVDATRADVLVRNGRSAEAEALLATTLRDDPNNARAHEVMGFLKFRAGDIPSAKKWFGEAVQLNSDSFLASYYFAAMSLQMNDTDHDDSIESSLRTSIKLNPDFAPAYDTLARFYAIRHQRLDEAHMLNAEAVQRDPANLAYRINTANVLMEEQQFENAKNVLKLALTVAKTPDQIKMVQDRIQQIDKYQADLERAKTQNSTTVTQTFTTTQSGSSPSDASRVMVFSKVNGKVMGKLEEAPNYPADATGPHHTVQGILKNIRCSYPNVLALDLDQSGKTITLYSNNYYKIVFTTANYDTNDAIKPCTEIEDMKAKIAYAEVSSKNAAGQILSIELSK